MNGGEIVAEGTPEKVAAEPKSFTGQYLKSLLKRSSPSPLEGEGRGEGARPASSSAKAGVQSTKKTRSSKPRRVAAPDLIRGKSKDADQGIPDLITAK